MTTMLSPRPSASAIHPDQEVPPGALALILATLEAMTGRRALHQVRPRLSERAFLELALHAGAGVYRRMPPGRLRAQMPTPQAVEATVSVMRGDRWVSCVIRLDATRRSWMCSEFVILAPRTAAA